MTFAMSGGRMEQLMSHCSFACESRKMSIFACESGKMSILRPEWLFWHVSHENWALFQKGPLGHMIVKRNPGKFFGHINHEKSTLLRVSHEKLALFHECQLGIM